MVHFVLSVQFYKRLDFRNFEKKIRQKNKLAPVRQGLLSIYTKTNAHNSSTTPHGLLCTYQSQTSKQQQQQHYLNNDNHTIRQHTLLSLLFSLPLTSFCAHSLNFAELSWVGWLFGCFSSFHSLLGEASSSSSYLRHFWNVGNNYYYHYNKLYFASKVATQLDNNDSQTRAKFVLF